MTPTIARTLFEAKSPYDGIYADMAKGEFYAQCPECKHVHGNFSSAADAANGRLCGSCRYERVMKHKKDLERIGKPVKSKKRPWPLCVGESVVQRMLGEALGTRRLIQRMMDERDWIQKALADLRSHFNGSEFRPTARHETDAENPDSTTWLTVESDDLPYEITIFRDEDAAKSFAVDNLRQQFQDEPETYMSWLSQFIDFEKAAEESIRHDGWASSLSSYDGNYDTLSNGSVWFRS